MKIPFFDYQNIYYRFKSEFIEIFDDVCSRGAYILQEDLEKFEESLKSFTGIKHVLGVNDGTNAMIVGMNCIGFEPNDEVIISGHTYIATAAAIKLSGAIPICADIDKDGMLCPDSASKIISQNTRAIMPTQLNGRCSNMKDIMSLVEEKNLILMEDSAQGLGATDLGIHAGGFGKFGTLSFYPAKLIGCFGDGGAILTNDDDIYEQAKMYRDHGRNDQGLVQGLGTNARLDNLQAAFLSLRLRHYDEDIKRRREIAFFYESVMSKSELFKLPKIENGNNGTFNVFQNYEIEVKNRDQFKSFLQDNGIGSLIQWGGYPIYNIPTFEDTKSSKIDYKKTDNFFSECIMLPMHMGLTDEHLSYIENVLNAYINQNSN
jgi:dTDP-4-amino-4,6-dideoxygalactose transaminase